MKEKDGIQWETSSSENWVTARGKCGPDKTRSDVLMAMRVAENPNMPRFKVFSNGEFVVTYVDD